MWRQTWGMLSCGMWHRVIWWKCNVMQKFVRSRFGISIWNSLKIHVFSCMKRLFHPLDSELSFTAQSRVCYPNHLRFMVDEMTLEYVSLQESCAFPCWSHCTIDYAYLSPHEGSEQATYFHILGLGRGLPLWPALCSWHSKKKCWKNIPIIKPTRCTSFPNYLFLHNTVHVSDGLSVHHQEFKTDLQQEAYVRQTRVPVVSETEMAFHLGPL
jgi:hypothetical protein